MEKNIFNNSKSDYSIPSLFLGEEMGVIDSIHRHYPELWRLYKKLKSQDWDENEFDLTSCNRDFKTCSRTVYEMMLLTLAWQWEADSIASRSLYSIAAPFISSTELNCLYPEIVRNENVHALTYSEIFRNSFDNPEEIIPMVQKMSHVVERSKVVTDIFAEIYTTSHLLAMGEISRHDPIAYEAIFKFIVTMYCLERVQFMPSFSVTFAIANSGIFVPAGKSVQKIAQDELEIHVEAHKTTLDYELRTDRGLTTFNKLRPFIEVLLKDIIRTEVNWIKHLTSEGRELPGVDEASLIKWLMYCAKDPIVFFGMADKFEDLPSNNPLKFMNEWLNIDKIQVSPQEENPGGYLLGAISKTLGDTVLESEDL